MVELQKVIDPPLEALSSRLRDRGLIRDDVPFGDLILAFKTLQLGLTSVWVVEGPPWKQSYQLARQQVRIFCEGVAKAWTFVRPFRLVQHQRPASADLQG